MSDAVAADRRTTRSGELYERALEVLVDGVASPSRGSVNYRPYPLFMARGEGGELVDVDGNRYVDLMLAYGALPHGHAHPRLVRTAQEAVERSALLATASYQIASRNGQGAVVASARRAGALPEPPRSSVAAATL